MTSNHHTAGARIAEDRFFDAQTPLERLQRAGVSILVGLGIGFVLWLGSGGLLWAYLLACGWIGLVIYAVSIALCSLARPALAKLGGWPLRTVLGAIFFVSGTAGFVFAIYSLDWLLRQFAGSGLSMGNEPVGFLSLAFPGAVGLIAGLAFFTYDSLRERLRASVLRIQEQEVAERELETARTIQRRLLPAPTLDGPGYRVAARNLPARQVAGDFYDILPGLRRGGPRRAGDDRFPGEDRGVGAPGDDGGALGLAVADVSGKGMGASLVMASVKASLSFLAPGRAPAEVLVELNRRLVTELGPREFVALCFVLYQPESGRFELANAGLPDPYVVRAAPGADQGLPDGGAGHGAKRATERGGGAEADGATDGIAGRPAGRHAAPEAIVAPGPRLPLGLRDGMAYSAVRGQLAPGDRLVLLTDGLPEAQTAAGEPLGYAGFERLLAEPAVHPGEPERWLDELVARLESVTLEHRDDDWTALVLERTA